MIRQIIKEALQEKLVMAMKKFFVGKVFEDRFGQSAKVLDVTQKNYLTIPHILFELEYSNPDHSHNAIHREIEKQVREYFFDGYTVMFVPGTEKSINESADEIHWWITEDNTHKEKKPNRNLNEALQEKIINHIRNMFVGKVYGVLLISGIEPMDNIGGIRVVISVHETVPYWHWEVEQDRIKNDIADYYGNFPITWRFIRLKTDEWVKAIGDHPLLNESVDEKLFHVMKKYFIGKVYEDDIGRKAKIMDMEEAPYNGHDYILFGLQYSNNDSMMKRKLHGLIMEEVYDYFGLNHEVDVQFYTFTKKPLLESTNDKLLEYLKKNYIRKKYYHNHEIGFDGVLTIRALGENISKDNELYVYVGMEGEGVGSLCAQVRREFWDYYGIKAYIEDY
jgi:hypothetical protein